MKSLSDYVVFNDKKLARKYAHARIPMATLYEAYFDGDIDIPGDIYALLRDRNLFVKYTITAKHLKWAVTNLIPEVAIHSKKQDERIVREHGPNAYDFTNDNHPVLGYLVSALVGIAVIGVAIVAILMLLRRSRRVRPGADEDLRRVSA